LNAIRFTPTGTTLVAATSGELRGWDPRTGKVKFRLNYPEGGSVNSGRVTSRDEFALIVNSSTGHKPEFRYYSFTGKYIAHSPPLAMEDSQHTAFSADGSLAAIVHQGAFAVYEGATAKEKWRESLPPEAVGGCWFFPDGSAVALATKGAVKVYASATGKVTAELKVGPATEKKEAQAGGRGRDWTQDVVVSADGRWLAGGVGEDGDEVMVWDVKSKAVRHRLKSSAKPLGFTPDGSELATYSTGTVTFWNVTTGKAARTFDVPGDDDIHLSPDGKMLACAAGDAAVLLDAATGAFLPHSPVPPGTPSGMWFTTDGRLVGTLSGWGGWVEWSLPAGTARLIRAPASSGQTALGLAADRQTALYRRKDDYELRAIATGKVLGTAKGPAEPRYDIPPAAMTPDGKAIVLVHTDGLSVVCGKDSSVIKRQGESSGSAGGVIVSENGQFAALTFERTNDQNHVELYDIGAARFLRRFGIDGNVDQVALAAEGPWLAAAHHVNTREQLNSGEKAVTVFDLASGRSVLQIPPDENRDSVMALSPDGRLLARWEHQAPEGKPVINRIAVWEILAGKVRTRVDTGGTVASIAFSRDGRTLAASVQGAPVFAWDLFAEPKARPGGPAQVEQAWEELKGDDAAKAFVAVRWLTHNSGLASEFLREKLPPVPPPDPSVVNRQIADLDHKDFRKREAASRALAELGERARDALQKALAAGVSPEARTRIERLLDRQTRVTVQQLRGLRAVEAMEVAGTREARDLLTHWAGGAAGAGLTRSAAAALKRLDVRTST
jgi:WD40 repeat protein